MKDIVYYPCTQEIFDIRNLDGIVYYVVHKNKAFEKKHIATRSSRVKPFNNEADREIGGQLNNAAYDIIKKLDNTLFCSKIHTYSIDYFGLGAYDKGDASGKYRVMQGDKIYGYKDNIDKNLKDVDRYKAVIQQMQGNGYYGNDGRTVALNKIYIYEKGDITPWHYIPLIISNSREECESFKSYLDTRFVRFLTLVGLIGQTLSNDEFFRFVPDPGKFDHKFTDQELYKKYNLTDEEIHIIESVIKERK